MAVVQNGGHLGQNGATLEEWALLSYYFSRTQMPHASRRTVYGTDGQRNKIQNKNFIQVHRRPRTSRWFAQCNHRMYEGCNMETKIITLQQSVWLFSHLSLQFSFRSLARLPGWRNEWFGWLIDWPTELTKWLAGRMNDSSWVIPSWSAHWVTRYGTHLSTDPGF